MGVVQLASRLFVLFKFINCFRYVLGPDFQCQLCQFRREIPLALLVHQAIIGRLQVDQSAYKQH